MHPKPPAAALLAIPVAGCLIAGCAGSAGQAAPHAHQAAQSRQAAHAHGRHNPPAIYLAEGQDATGTTVLRPGCASGCPLNSLGTVVLYDMHWSRWDGARAAGTGTATLQQCGAVCSGMPQYQVRVRVAFSRPVRDCRTGQAYWTRVRLGYPGGTGGAPLPPDPWDFTALAAAARAGCGRT